MPLFFAISGYFKDFTFFEKTVGLHIFTAIVLLLFFFAIAKLLERNRITR
jgi:fucose 4-O-acetylase-like acetyltransferase